MVFHFMSFSGFILALRMVERIYRIFSNPPGHDKFGIKCRKVVNVARIISTAFSLAFYRVKGLVLNQLQTTKIKFRCFVCRCLFNPIDLINTFHLLAMNSPHFNSLAAVTSHRIRFRSHKLLHGEKRKQLLSRSYLTTSYQNICAPNAQTNYIGLNLEKPTTKLKIKILPKRRECASEKERER